MIEPVIEPIRLLVLDSIGLISSSARSTMIFFVQVFNFYRFRTIYDSIGSTLLFGPVSRPIFFPIDPTNQSNRVQKTLVISSNLDGI